MMSVDCPEKRNEIVVKNKVRLEKKGSQKLTLRKRNKNKLVKRMERPSETDSNQFSNKEKKRNLNKPEIMKDKQKLY